MPLQRRAEARAAAEDRYGAVRRDVAGGSIAIVLSFIYRAKQKELGFFIFRLTFKFCDLMEGVVQFNPAGTLRWSARNKPPFIREITRRPWRLLWGN